jgi:hypothetical protein
VPPDDELLRRVVVRRTGVRVTVRGADAVLVSDLAGAPATPVRSAALMLSSGAYGVLAAAVERSEFKALSAASCDLSPFEQANARAAAGRIRNFLNIKASRNDPRSSRRWH